MPRTFKWPRGKTSRNRSNIKYVCVCVCVCARARVRFINTHIEIPRLHDLNTGRKLLIRSPGKRAACYSLLAVTPSPTLPSHQLPPILPLFAANLVKISQQGHMNVKSSKMRVFT